MNEHRAVHAKETATARAPAREQLLVAGSAVSGLGAAVAATFAALCCVGPWAVAVLGVGGAVAAASLAPYRPVFLLASLIVIAFGFWRAYGRRTIVDGHACPVRVGRFSRTALWLAAGIWLVASLLPSS